MIGSLRSWWESVRDSLWFVPAIMSAVGILLAYTLLLIESLFGREAAANWLLYSGTVENAWDLTSELLGGMITMTSLVISITMVVLTLAASQLGPRIIYGFINDRGNQAVLGLFVATILFLLFVLRSMQGRLGAPPHLAVSAGIVLFVLSFFVLLYFVHKMARAISNDAVVQSLWRDLQDATARELDGNPEATDAVPAKPREMQRLVHDVHGYVGFIDYQTLSELAAERGLQIWLGVKVGDYVSAGGGEIAVARPEPLDEEALACIRSAIHIRRERTPLGDLTYHMRQLEEIALRALSPSLNDPHTAINVVDYLGSAVAEIFARHLPAPVVKAKDGRVLLVRAVLGYGDIVDAAFEKLRHAAATQPAVLVRIAQALDRLVPCARRADQRAALLRHLGLVERTGRRRLDEPEAQEFLVRICSETRQRLV